MKIHIYPIGEMRANCYLIENEGVAILIDPGDSADFLLSKVLEKNLKLSGIVATHGHFDHVMAVGEIQLTYPKLALHISPDDKFLLNRVVETARHFLSYEPAVIPVGKTKNLATGKFELCNLKFEIINAPGHTPGSVCLYLEEQSILFSGDTIFQMGVGRFDFSYSSKEDLKKSIARILKLPKNTVVYPGHGEETTIEQEKNLIKMFF